MPKHTDAAGRRKGLLSVSTYLIRAQLRLGRRFTKEELKLARTARLDHVNPHTFADTLSPTGRLPHA